MLSRGADYVDARGGMKLYDLDRIIVLEDSNAVLAMADDCIYRVKGAQMLSLQTGDTCDTVAARVDSATLERGATSQLGGGGGAAAGTSIGGVSTGTAILGAGAVAGGAWAVSNGNGSDDNRRATAQRQQLVGDDDTPPLSPE
ncbi:MAG: hypothetical protein WBG92_11390 [Thiohalocapsa sp.]